MPKLVYEFTEDDRLFADLDGKPITEDELASLAKQIQGVWEERHRRADAKKAAEREKADIESQRVEEHTMKSLRP